jgi:hypothetical protein
MHTGARIPRLRGPGKAVLAGVLVFLLVISGLAAGSSALHEWLHADHASSTHFCLISMLQHGHSHSPATDFLPAVPPSCLLDSAPPEICSFVSIDSPLFSGRGPPGLA